MKGVSDYAIVYDIASDNERSKVGKVLKDFGLRVQKSVFECRLNKKGKIDLIEKLERLEIKTGFIKIYRLEYSSAKSVIGVSKKKDIDDGHAFII